MFKDSLSYGGRTFLFIPVFHYILAIFSSTLTVGIALKLIPNLFASSIVLIVYLITKKITKNDQISLITSFVSAFIFS